MIDTLYKKLYIVFVSAMMIVITIVIIIFQYKDISLHRSYENQFFQRMNTLLIFQLDAQPETYPTVFQNYEQRYQMFSVLKDKDNTTIYHSESSFPTSTTTLLQYLERNLDNSLTLSQQDNNIYTNQNGILRFVGDHEESYIGTTSTIVSNDNNQYTLSLIMPQTSTVSLLKETAAFYIIIWFLLLVSVLFLCQFFMKKAFIPATSTLQSQKNFIASASHELKAPLAVILANAEAMEDSSREQIKRHITTIHKECQSMSHLIQDMLLLAKSDVKTWSLQKKQIDIDTLLITIYENYNALCAKKQITLTLLLANENYPTVYTDAYRLTQILEILIDNAIHYSFPNTEIILETKMTRKKIIFLVIDHGKGILEKDKPYIFDRFYCVDSSHTEKGHFGLGLSIAKELTHMLGGDICVEDTIGGGCTFSLSLPLKKTT